MRGAYPHLEQSAVAQVGDGDLCPGGGHQSQLRQQFGQSRREGEVDDSIIQVQGDRAYLARSEERRFPGDIQDRALRKLRQVDAAATIEDLRNPPSSKLEVLKGNQAGQMSIRINDQFRVCFVWHDGDADDAEIVDYH